MVVLLEQQEQTIGMGRSIIYSKLVRHLKKSPVLYTAGLVLAIVIIVGILQVNTNPRKEVDWLNSLDWSHFTGAEKTEAGIKIWATERVINHSDTSAAQPNPPVNIRGSYLKVPNDFKVDMKISGIDNEATAQFYGQVPIIYDEWRQERPSIRLQMKNDGIYVRIWDGTASSSIDERNFKIDLKNNASINIVHQQDKFTIQANGRTIGAIPDHKIFADGTIWFGSDAKPGTEGWTLNKLTAQSLSKEPVRLTDAISITDTADNPNSLRNLSKKNNRQLPIGAAISVGTLLTDKQYNELALSQFSMMTPENSFNPQVIHPLKDTYLFEDTDILVEAAQNNKMIVHGHALVMPKANPEWMQDIPDNELRQVMIDHESTIMSRYKGKIAEWDVVNEPMSEDDIDYNGIQKGIRKQMWFDVMGEEYIDIAFKAARVADPTAKLYLNDFGLENDGKRWDAFLSLIIRLQARGVPIDGVGFEAHVYHEPADTIDPAVLKQHIQTLAALGIDSRISEIDVLGDDPKFQAKQYADVLQVCVSEPTCKSYGVWGITDLYGSTTLSDRYPVMLGDSLLWDVNYTPKPALKSLKAVLSQP